MRSLLPVIAKAVSWITCTPTSTVVSEEEFGESVRRLQEWSAQVASGSTPTVHYTSALRVCASGAVPLFLAIYHCTADDPRPAQLREDRQRHRRLMDDPQTYSRRPLTSSQAGFPPLCMSWPEPMRNKFSPCALPYCYRALGGTRPSLPWQRR